MVVGTPISHLHVLEFLKAPVKRSKIGISGGDERVFVGNTVSIPRNEGLYLGAC